MKNKKPEEKNYVDHGWWKPPKPEGSFKKAAKIAGSGILTGMAAQAARELGAHELVPHALAAAGYMYAARKFNLLPPLWTRRKKKNESLLRFKKYINESIGHAWSDVAREIKQHADTSRHEPFANALHYQDFDRAAELYNGASGQTKQDFDRHLLNHSYSEKNPNLWYNLHKTFHEHRQAYRKRKMDAASGGYTPGTKAHFAYHVHKVREYNDLADIAWYKHDEAIDKGDHQVAKIYSERAQEYGNNMLEHDRAHLLPHYKSHPNYYNNIEGEIYRHGSVATNPPHPYKYHPDEIWEYHRMGEHFGSKL